jgi:integrase
VRVRLKGINSYTARLADGSTVTYWYAWKGGPRLKGEPGTPEFTASYNEAVARKITPPVGILSSVLQKFRDSQAFKALADRTKSDYLGKIQLIEKEFGTFPLSALSDQRTRGVFREWRDKLAAGSERQADYAFAVFSLVLAWALAGGLVEANPCTRMGRLYGGSRADKIWKENDEANFNAKAPGHMHLPLLMALWTGQRQGDLLALRWWTYDGKYLRITQSKSVSKKRRRQPVRVVIPVAATLKAALDAARVGKGLQDHILLNSDGKPWTADGFRSSWRKACAAAGVAGVTFHDLRGTAVTRLAIAGCTEAEIATITGHSLRDVRTVLDANYLHRDPALAQSAIKKLEKGTNFPNELPNGLEGSQIVPFKEEEK